MVYIFNKHIPPKKNIQIALTKIFGIGKYRANVIMKSLMINPKIRFYNLKQVDISKLTKYIVQEFKVSSFLQKEIKGNIEKYRKIRHYKGIRHEKNLPVRGQRTHTNAKTRKKDKSLRV